MPAQVMSLEEKREKARLRKQKSRAAAAPELRLPMPAGLEKALSELIQACPDFDDPRDFLSHQILRLHALMDSDRHAFEAQTKRTVTIGRLDHFFDRLVTEESLAPDEN